MTWPSAEILLSTNVYFTFLCCRPLLDVICDPRVEMLNETEDKAKGGNDFQEVRKVS